MKSTPKKLQARPGKCIIVNIGNTVCLTEGSPTSMPKLWDWKSM